MKERLKNIRLKLGYSQQEMADKLNMPVRVYRNYEYVSKNYPVEFIQNLIDIFSINANYLFSGQGDIFLDINKNNVYNSVSPKKEFTAYNLAKFQEENNISDRNMAKKLGIFEYEYIDLKHGEIEPTFKILNRLKQSFNVSIDWLFFEN